MPHAPPIISHCTFDLLTQLPANTPVILLNGPSLPELNTLLTSPNLVVADGAANLLAAHSTHLPRYIVGDLDSITPTTIAHYKRQNVQILHDDDQDTTDFDKAIRLAMNMNNIGNSIVVVGGYNGRFDQTMSNLHTIFKYSSPVRHIYWFDSNTLSVVLSPGMHQIHINAAMEGPICGLVPLGNTVHQISTTGLRWNLSQVTLRMDLFVSTSNEVVKSPITVSTSDPILWTHTINTSSR